jgi:NAD(P)-dependent dehydrogenase (short-subunit alcohol dehydrogenase family)
MNVVVTGGSRGIGAAIVETIVKDGAKAIIHYGRDKISADALLERIGGRGWTIGADFTDPDAPGKFFAEALLKAGRVHGLVNNAGIRTTVSIEADDAAWRAAWAKEMQVNLYAPADLCRAAILHYRQHGGGRIVNMASRAGQRGYTPDCLPYGASKAGLNNITKTIARSFGHEGVIAVAIAPGWVRTEMADGYTAIHGLQAAVGDIPIGKMAETAEVAELVSFALRPSQLSINGSTLDINGGSYVRS